MTDDYEIDSADIEHEIDHRARAADLAELAAIDWDEGHQGRALFRAELAQVHATLAPPAPAQDDQYWQQARELEELRKAVLALHQSSAKGSATNRVEVGIRPYSRLTELAGL